MDAVLRLLIAFIALGWIAWLWGRKQYGHQRKPVLAGFSALILAGLTTWLVFSAANLVQIDVPLSANTELNSGAVQAGQWQPYSPEVLESALAQGQPVFVDFTAAWCVSCQVNKKAVLETDSMKQFFTQRKVVLLRANWTRRDPAITEALAALGRNGVPVYVLYRPGKAPLVLPELLQRSTIVEALATL